MPDVINWLKAATNYIFRLQKVTRGCTEDAQLEPLSSKQGVSEMDKCKQAVGGNLCMQYPLRNKGLKHEFRAWNCTTSGQCTFWMDCMTYGSWFP